MKLLFSVMLMLIAGVATKTSAQPCNLLATLTSSNIRITPRDPDFRDKCVIDVTVTNPGTCGWEKGKVKLNWELTGNPDKAKSFPKELLSGSCDVKAVVLPGKQGQFTTINFPWPEYPGSYEFNFWISYNGKELSKEVPIVINWD